METVVKATTDRELGTRSSRRLRAEGRLPGVVYGLNKEPQPVSVDYIELKTALTQDTGLNTVFALDVEGSSETVIVRSLQRDPIKRVVIHADFLRIDPTQKIKVKVPIKLIGDDKAVTSEGGMVEQQIFEVEIEVSPTAIPESIEADLSIMTLERRIAVEDLNFPEGVSSSLADDVSVVSPVIPRAFKADDEQVVLGEDGEPIESEEGEGEDAEGAEGEESSGDSGGDESSDKEG